MTVDRTALLNVHVVDYGRCEQAPKIKDTQEILLILCSVTTVHMLYSKIPHLRIFTKSKDIDMELVGTRDTYGRAKKCTQAVGRRKHRAESNLNKETEVMILKRILKK
jgi:hypothetical protein